MKGLKGEREWKGGRKEERENGTKGRNGQRKNKLIKI